MSVIKPMLAVPMEKVAITNWRDWAVEEKFDGHRLVIEVQAGTPIHVQAWSRPRRHAGSDGKTMARRTLPLHLTADLARLPFGTYDGELLGGETSTDVTRTDLAHTLRFVVFDVMHYNGKDVTHMTYADRRRILLNVFAHLNGSIRADLNLHGHLALAQSIDVTCAEDVTKVVKHIWASGGEGAMLKRKAAAYQPGKRSKDLVKVKKLETCVCTVVGFEPTSGKVLRRGIFASVILEDKDGNRTSVKTRDDVELERFRKEWGVTLSSRPALMDMIAADNGSERTALRLANEHHPAIGRKLRIEYQDWTPRGGYRHPRWDRWEEE